jgi:hypothetical protein
MANVNELYLFLDSRDSLSIHADNKASDFTVELPQCYYLQGNWECALIELRMRLHSASRIYVFSDVVEDSYVRNAKICVLRTVDLRPKKIIDIVYSTPIYLKVKLQELSRISILVRDDKLETCKSINAMYCALQRREDI